MNYEEVEKRELGPEFNGRIVLIGQAWGRIKSCLRHRACTGFFMKKILGISGLNQHTYFKIFERHNLLDFYPGAVGNGDAFPMHEAKAVVQSYGDFLTDRKIILAGRNVAKAFGRGNQEFLKWYGNFVVIPHPSGRNRWWNDAGNWVQSARFFRSLVDVYHDQVEALICQQNQVT